MKRNVVKEEILQIKYIQDQTFEGGIRRDKFVKRVNKNDFMYGVIHFTNGLKLLIDNSCGLYSPPKISTSYKAIASGKSYKVKYKLSWEGYTKFNNGSVIEMSDISINKPNEIIAQKHHIDAPENVANYINSIIDYLKPFSLDDYKERLLRVEHRWINEKVWIAINLFHMTNETALISLKVFKFIQDNPNPISPYDGVSVEQILSSDLSKEYSSDEIIKSIDMMDKTSYIICYDKEKNTIFPFYYTD